ncbi:flagellar biosynthetic protein FliO [Ornithinibacillus sp. 179-J 7C1 HS]|uniref:flagellar biosynthetic protein FliO n=1 Tax=Ornithinibacillus sp. 179-J 7C1 HS TaxID=3142384 RepID=UPI0039A341CA
MGKKSCLGILFGLLLFLLVSPSNVYADGDKVSDWYDNENDSEQELDGSDTNSPDNSNQQPVSEVSENGSLAFDLVKMVFALFLILALIYLLLKFLSKRNKLFNQVKTLENLGGISVGPSKSIQVIRVGGKLYLIGVGENVQLLEEIVDEGMKEEILSSYQEQADFKPEKILSLFQSKNNQATEKTDNANQNFKNLFSNELEKLKQNRRNLMNKHTEKEDNHE